MKHSQQGVGLVEVMVSLLILSVAILGFIAMQLQSLKATSESIDRTQALTIMRSFAERIRTNSSVMDTYATAFHQIKDSSFSQPSKLCLPSDSNPTKCTAEQLANADAWQFKQQLDGFGMTMDLLPCPSSGGGTSTNIMYSYCLIAAWEDTTPTIGSDNDPSDGAMDCLTQRDASNADAVKTGGTYHPKATCVFMEVN